MSAQSEAYAYLRHELADLRRLKIEPERQAVIARMITRRAELSRVFHIIWYGADAKQTELPDGCLSNDEYDSRYLIANPKRVLQQITLTATACCDAAETKEVREARRKLPELLERFKLDAWRLSELLGEINTEASRAQISLPCWLTYDTWDLVDRAAMHCEGSEKQCLYESWLKPRLESAVGTFDCRYYPTIKELLLALSQHPPDLLEEAERNEVVEYVVRGRQSNRVAEFVRALRLHLAGMARNTRIDYIEFSYADQARLVEVCLGFEEMTIEEDQIRKADRDRQTQR